MVQMTRSASTFQLGQAFVTADYAIDENVTLKTGAGFGMRAPTMAEMYSVGYFATVTPQFILTSPAGNSLLKAEKRTQIDIGFTAEYENFRGGLNGYHAWIKDFITLDFAGTLRQGGTLDPAILWLHQYTDLATLAGFEGYAEHDVNDWFSNLSGRSASPKDATIRDVGPNYPFSTATFGGPGRSNRAGEEEPLPVIFPLEARLGLRVTEPLEWPLGSRVRGSDR